MSNNLSVFQQFIFQRTYAKFLEEKQRKETWEECVDRYINYIFEDLPEHFILSYKEECRDAILKLKVVPSMRMLLTSGDAHRKENASGYNCCFLPVDDTKVFSELLYLLLQGVGCGFTVNKESIEKLPVICDDFKELDEYIVIGDSKLEWAEAFDKHITSLYTGHVYKFDYSKIRAKGTPLKTLGAGYASGYEPLKELIDFTTELFKKAKGRKFKDIECHSLCCRIGSIIVVAGIRRSAMISFSDLESEDMAKAKSGEWYKENIHFSLANNSAIYKTKPSMPDFLKEYTTIYNSYSGERGFYNLEAVNKKIDKIERRREINKDRKEFFTNPCCEIILRGDGEFCNLTEVIIRDNDTEETLKHKIEIATILGTIQSKYTDFKFIRPIFKKNCEEERLLGVSLSGIFDNPLTYNPKPEFLESLRDYSILVNKEVSKILGINPSVAITTVKPSGTVGALAQCSNGIHPAFSKYYIRRVRVSKNDPLCAVLIANNIKFETDFYSSDNYVFEFYLKSADKAITVDSLSAVEHFKIWRLYNNHYTEHKPSITICYEENEYLELGAEIYKYFDEMTGIALLPKSNSTYKQMPFEKITEEQYLEGIKTMPTSINWNIIKGIKFDNTNIDQIVCLGTNCDSV
jgi:ribonucleoside-diphosphate reductase alpha chain